MTTEETLINKYGALLTISQLAEILSRSVDGTRMSLRTQNVWSERINATRLKIGRRVYFLTSEIAQYLADA
jgi:hypothetical protein